MCVMAAHKPDPDPETPERATRRKFPTTYKLKVLAELDKAGPNQIGVIQRREGLYSSVVSTWKRQRDEGTLTALAPKKRGRKPTKDPMDKENERLRRRVAQLEHFEGGHDRIHLGRFGGSTFLVAPDGPRT